VVASDWDGCRGARRRAVSAPEQPLFVATDLGAAAWPSLGVLFALVAAASAYYVRAIARARPLPLTTLLFAAAGGVALACLAPVLFSSDVYAYAAYGEMARIGLNPYARVYETSDYIVRAAQAQWIAAFPICVYGPAFVQFARALVTALSPFGLRAILDAFRAASSIGFLLCVPLAYGAFAGDRSARLRSAAAIALNPAAIWCAAEGHNDAIALAVVLLGFALMRRRLRSAGAAVVALSALVKAPGAAAAMALAVADRRARLGAVAGLAAAVVFSLPLFAGITKNLAPHGTYAPQASLQAIFAPVSPILAWCAAAATCAFLAANGVFLLRRRSTEGWIWFGLAAWVLVPNPYPWYGIWLVALAALEPRSRAATVAIVLSLVSLLRYVPDAVATPSPPLGAALGLLAVLPLLALLPRRPVIMSDSYDR
jgi:alpha-1,6-mannosyltransferase